MGKSLENDVAVVVSLDVVESDDAGKIQISIERTRLFCFLRVIQDFDVRNSERWVQNILDVLEYKIN